MSLLGITPKGKDQPQYYPEFDRKGIRMKIVEAAIAAGWDTKKIKKESPGLEDFIMQPIHKLLKPEDAKR